MRTRSPLALIAALTLAGQASAMTAAEFLAKADALKAKGMMAMFSSDLGLIKTEFNDDAKAWRAQAHRPNACPPEKISLNSDAILALVAAVPPQQRTTTSARAAIIEGLNRKYPCR